MIFGATRPARSLVDVWPGAPPPLVQVVDVALACEQERRWGNVAEMRTALANAMRLASSSGPARYSAPPPQGASGTLLVAGPTNQQAPVPLVPPGRTKR